MSISRLLSDLRGPWLMNRSLAEPFIPMVVSLLTGDKTTEGQATYIKSVDVEGGEGFTETQNVAVHTIHGPLYKWRTEYADQLFTEAEQDDSITAHVFDMDTPGGSVSSIEAFAKKVANSQKPVVVYVRNILASGGFWIAAPANHIMIAGETNVLGSIGTMIRFENYDGLLNKLGISIIEAYAKESKDKNRLVNELIKGNEKPIVKEYLDPTNDVFVNWMKEHRGNKFNLTKENVLTGNTYLGQKSIDAGLADSMGTLEDAINLAAKTAQSLKNQEDMSFLTNFLKSAQAKAKDEGKQLSQEELNQQAEAELARIEKENADMKAQIAELEKAQQQETLELSTQKEGKIESTENDRLAAIEASLKQLTDANAKLAQEKKELEDENKKLGEQKADPAAAAGKTDKFADQKTEIPLLDVEKKAVEQGATIDHSTFEREKGVNIF